jgi:hypothetical protein
LPVFCNVSPQACVAVALFVSILVYTCVDRGQLFAYFGWVHPLTHLLAVCAPRGRCRRGPCDCDHTYGAHAARPNLTGNIALRSHHRTDHRRDPVPRCGVFRHLRDRCIDQRAAQATAHDRDRPLFPALRARSHENDGNSVACFFGMGTLYTLLRWRSNSTAAAALMHATYNAVIALAMLHA